MVEKQGLTREVCYKMLVGSQSPLNLDLNIDRKKIQEDYLCDEIKQALNVIRPDWCKDLSSVKCKVFTGGISNQLYGYYQEGRFAEDVVLFRIYGEGTELMIDRDREKEIIQFLNAAGRSAPLYGTFNNGIIYGFVNGETLDENSVRDEKVRKLIAKEMLEVHKLKPEGHQVKSGLWDKLYNFLELSPEGFSDPEKHKQYLATVRPKDELRKELDTLKAHLETFTSSVVFCHNDLLLKNIIYDPKKNRVCFIDHEYAMYNFEHFELGNHFCEYAGVDDLDFQRYPDKEYQLTWLRYYLEQKSVQNGGSELEVTEKDVEECYVKTNKFALAAHLFWGIWGLVQAKNSVIDFGFLEYGQQKLDEYFAKRDEFIGLKLPE